MSTSASSRPEPMDLSNAKGDSEDKAELQVAEQSDVVFVAAIREEALMSQKPIAQAASISHGMSSCQGP